MQGNSARASTVCHTPVSAVNHRTLWRQHYSVFVRRHANHMHKIPSLRVPSHERKKEFRCCCQCKVRCRRSCCHRGPRLARNQSWHLSRTSCSGLYARGSSRSGPRLAKNASSNNFPPNDNAYLGNLSPLCSPEIGSISPSFRLPQRWNSWPENAKATEKRDLHHFATRFRYFENNNKNLASESRTFHHIAELNNLNGREKKAYRKRNKIKSPEKSICDRF